MSISFDELKEFYFELITTIVPGPASWSYFIPLLVLPLGLLIPPSILSHRQLCAIVLPISIVSTLHAWTVLGGNDVISTDCLYMTLFLYFFKDPRRNFRRVIRSDTTENSENPDAPQSRGSKSNEKNAVSDSIALETYPENFTGRLTWAAMLPQSRPLHDWIIGEPGHDRRALQSFRHPTRSRFTIDILSRLVPVLALFLPLSKQLAVHDPYFSDPTWSISSPYEINHHVEGKIATLLKTSIPAFILRPLTIAMYTYSLLLCLFLPPMLLALLLNAIHFLPDAWSPHTFRPHFGPISVVSRYGVRGFWGRWWHQQMRHIVSEPGRWAAGRLGLGDNGWQKRVKYMLVCLSAFVLSGITHSGMVPARPRFAVVGTGVLRLHLAAFFWVQPVGVAVELFLLEPVLSRLPESMREGLRVVWTMGFLCASCVFLVMPFGQLGYWKIIPDEYVPRLL
ncbi:hypothetical protein NX059_000837 [Plenodomus lindquistii]|nr:hypothetical protein NX059_000837 [Plenodomus lindquistii]